MGQDDEHADLESKGERGWLKDGDDPGAESTSSLFWTARQPGESDRDGKKNRGKGGACAGVAVGRTGRKKHSQWSGGRVAHRYEKGRSFDGSSYVLGCRGSVRK